MEDLNQRLTSLKEGLESTIDSKVEQSVEKNMGSDYKNQLKGEVNELISNHGKVVEDLNSRIDSLELDKQKSLHNAPPKNFSANLKEALADSPSFKSFMSGDSSKATLNLKAIMTTAANASGDTVPADRLNGFYYDPTRTTRVRDLLQSQLILIQVDISKKLLTLTALLLELRLLLTENLNLSWILLMLL